jgi:transcriptional regulator with XRE-family HTH domain
MMDERQALGSAIREIRRKRKLTITALHYQTRIGHKSIALIERGSVYTSLDILFAICQALEVKPSTLFEMAGL